MIARRGHDGHEPQPSAAESADIVELFRDAPQISEPVAVAVAKRAHKDLIPVDRQLRPFGQADRTEAQQQDQTQDTADHTFFHDIGPFQSAVTVSIAQPRSTCKC